MLEKSRIGQQGERLIRFADLAQAMKTSRGLNAELTTTHHAKRSDAYLDADPES